MKSLQEDLQLPKKSLKEFAEVTQRVLDHIPNVVSNTESYKGYIVKSSVYAGFKKYVRPICDNLFIFDSEEFIREYSIFIEVLLSLNKGVRKLNSEQLQVIDRVAYTMQQSIGVGLDLLGESNSARKHVGNRFEELIRLIVSEVGVANKKIVLNIPYPTDEGEKLYKCETDLVFSPHNKVKSDTKKIDPHEVVVSLKTSSKDRMGKIFIDKLLMQKFNNHEVKVLGIFLNDVQRKKDKGISFTFVSGLFMVYSEFLTKLDGVYFIDPPPKAKESPYNKYIFPFSKFLAEDIWVMLGS